MTYHADIAEILDELDFDRQYFKVLDSEKTLKYFLN
jgi:hypothetical protein